MHTKKHQEPPDPNFNWETRDIDIGFLAKSAVGLYLMVLVCAPLSIWIMSAMGGHVLSDGPGHYELRRTPKDPYPLLQDGATAAVDMNNLRRAEGKTLHSDGVTEDGKRHISIDEAIDLEASKAGR